MFEHNKCLNVDITDLSTLRGSLSEDEVHDGHQDQEEVKLVPAIAPVVVPAKPCDLDSSFDDEDSREGIVAVLLDLCKES